MRMRDPGIACTTAGRTSCPPTALADGDASEGPAKTMDIALAGLDHRISVGDACDHPGAANEHERNFSAARTAVPSTADGNAAKSTLSKSKAYEGLSITGARLPV